ncbi:type II RES/Xre toxin-antitoxin system antitoxin [Halotalea alkalilenta]|uniref:type II RES/Xre toxin-antitoxin system antitoxin n=1 Tax=Halotalea alkalilenta TaxID=376489 RepID=UPI000484127F|nr:antitoxin Xre/MbcA/ParS toxin-binding domain-containing protein [Halotalea alkalilenta]
MVTSLKQDQAGRDTGASFWKRVGMPPRGAGLHQALRDGIPYTVYTRLASMAGLEHKELAKYVVIPQATLQRRAKLGRFKQDEGDRLYRFAEVLEAATALFEGDKEGARQWLLHPVRGLGGRRPVEMLATSAEVEAVLELIGRLEHGVVA